MHKKYVECQKLSAGLYITGRKRKEKKEEERKKGKKDIRAILALDSLILKC